MQNYPEPAEDLVIKLIFSQETPESTRFASSLSAAGRLSQISDLVPLVEFLASPASGWINGQTIWINGGYLTR